MVALETGSLCALVMERPFFVHIAKAEAIGPRAEGNSIWSRPASRYLRMWRTYWLANMRSGLSLK